MRVALQLAEASLLRSKRESHEDVDFSSFRQGLMLVLSICCCRLTSGIRPMGSE